MNDEQLNLLAAYQHGLDDGFYDGMFCETLPLTGAEERAYRMGFDHGVAMYSDTLEEDAA